jgi:hypothetical protein
MQQLVLSSAEIGLIQELLRNEHNKLLVEIRHTDSRSFRDGLKQRLGVVETLTRKSESWNQEGSTALAVETDLRHDCG